VKAPGLRTNVAVAAADDGDAVKTRQGKLQTIRLVVVGEGFGQREPYRA
jgi:hypothetical protein